MSDQVRLAAVFESFDQNGDRDAQWLHILDLSQAEVARLTQENAQVKSDLDLKNAYIEAVLQLIDDYVEGNTTHTAAETLDAIDNVQLITHVPEGRAQPGTE